MQGDHQLKDQYDFACFYNRQEFTYSLSRTQNLLHCVFSYKRFQLDAESITKAQTSTFCNAVVGSEGGVRVLDRPLGAVFNPSFSRCSMSLPLL